MVEAEAKRCHDVEKPPVLSQKEFATLAGDTSDITDPEELSLGTCTVHVVLVIIIIIIIVIDNYDNSIINNNYDTCNLSVHV